MQMRAYIEASQGQRPENVVGMQSSTLLRRNASVFDTQKPTLPYIMSDMSIMEGKWGAGRETPHINVTTSREMRAPAARQQPMFNVFEQVCLTTTIMSITPSMIAENDRIEEEVSRANFAVFLAAQEAESRRCQRLRETAAPAVHGIVSMQ